MASTKRQGHSRDIVSSLTDPKLRGNALGTSFLIPGARSETGKRRIVIWAALSLGLLICKADIISLALLPHHLLMRTNWDKVWESASENSKEPPTGKVLLCHGSSRTRVLGDIQTKLLVSGSSHLCGSLASAYPCGKRVFYHLQGMAWGRSLGLMGWRGGGWGVGE